MPNWCTTYYVLEGDKKEIRTLNKTLNKLMSRKKPAIENGFGNNWLGCLVNALGGDWKEIRCRGSWDDNEITGDVLRLTTETAWGAMNEVFDFICKKFPSIKYYYSAEEPMMGEFYTNDKEGKYFPDRYQIDLCTPKEEYENEYFQTLADALKWLSDNYCPNNPLHSEEDVDTLDNKWREESDEAFITLNTYRVLD